MAKHVMSDARRQACEIVDIFDSFLDNKGIEVDCEDPDEEALRHDDDNYAALYGTEYWTLVNQIEDYLKG